MNTFDRNIVKNNNNTKDRSSNESEETRRRDESSAKFLKASGFVSLQLILSVISGYKT